MVPPPALVDLDDARCAQLLEIVEYVKEIHGHIDPEMFDVQTRHFDATTAVLARAAHHIRVEMTRDERELIDTVVEAAWTYSCRSNGNGLALVKDAEFKRLLEWLGPYSPRRNPVGSCAVTGRRMSHRRETATRRSSGGAPPSRPGR
jgi:hypothetical protein